ncbi:hypothetical protein BGZ50_004805 [Haplosporangium sp. Z 11]|nr:hypothetical protein BGZ50_004805 [Haplosporangium sp. Z 11]
MPYPPTTLTQSIVSQLSVEFKRTYRKGNLKLHKKLQAQKVKGRLPAEFDIEIHADVSSIEDFVRLNKINKNHRRLMHRNGSVFKNQDFSLQGCSQMRVEAKHTNDANQGSANRLQLQ